MFDAKKNIFLLYMARKSSKSVKISKKLEINFEVVLIIILIIVAILLVCFLNRKFSGVEGFYNDKTTSASVTSSTSNKDEKQLHFFYADWCGYSTKYIEDYLPDLEKKLGNDIDKLQKYNVDDDESKAQATLAGVTKLPSFYTFTNGKYDEEQHFIEKKMDKNTNDLLVNWLKK